ncbi:MAG: hypothetical protein SFY56_03170 [Bacteroidota bacterium]|nr:hypothetical protein [Bacteroidota bacterium]
MKSLKIILLSLLVCKVTAQEQIQYKIITDEPRKINNFSLNIDAVHFDFPLGNIDGSNFCYGIWGHAMFKQKLGIDYTFRNAWLTFGRLSDKTLKNRTNIQLGGFFIFNQNTKYGNNTVVLKQTNSVVNGKNVTTTTSIRVPSNKWKYKALRAGLYLNRNLVSIENPLGKDFQYNYYIFGAYGGICFGSTRRLFIQTDKYGEKGVISHLRVCFDGLITPINNAPTGVKNTLPVGGRLLIQTLPTLQRKDRKKKYRAVFVAEIEAGYRMVDGLYFGGSIAIPISRSIKFLRSDAEDQTIKRTTE